MQIIPAIDIIDGKCVRLTKGDYNQKTQYHDDPVEVAKSFEAAGLNRLHLVDLDGAKSKKIVNDKVLKGIAENTDLHIDFGGGIKSITDAELAFVSGAKQITGGSIAVKDPDTFKGWIQKYGPDKIILGADVLDGKVATSGWQEINEVDVFEFIDSYLKEGIEQVICTDISKDGVLAGPSIELYKSLLTEFPSLKLIASGGVSNINDVEALANAGLYGAIIGKAIYEEKISLEQLAEFVINAD